MSVRHLNVLVFVLIARRGVNLLSILGSSRSFTRTDASLRFAPIHLLSLCLFSPSVAAGGRDQALPDLHVGLRRHLV